MENLTILNEYIIPFTLAFCLTIGFIVKQLDFIPNKFIPLVVGVVGVLVNLWNNNFEITPMIVLQGLASGLASTGVFEVFKNLKVVKQEK